MPSMKCAGAIPVLFGSCALAAAQGIQPADLWKQPVAAADHKLAYGRDPLQFGELRLPKTKGAISCRHIGARGMLRGSSSRA